MEGMTHVVQGSGIDILSVKDFLNRHIDGKPVLKKPLSDLSDLPEYIWWTRGIERVRTVSLQFQLSAQMLIPFSETFINLDTRLGFASDAEALAAFDVSSQWISQCEEMRRFLSDMNCSRLMAQWCIDAYTKGMRIEYLLSRMRGERCKRGCHAFLLACTMGNYPFAYDERGTLYVLCA